MIELMAIRVAGWGAAHLGDVTRIRYGKSLHKNLRDNSGRFPVVGSAGVMTRTNEPLVNSPCVVVGRKGNVGSVQYFIDGCYPIDTVYYFEAPSSIDGRFLALNLGALRLKELDSSTAIPSLRREDLDQVQLSIPPLAEQHRIVEILEEQFSRLDAALASLRTMREKAALFRRALLQAAFSGGLSTDHASWKVLPVSELLTDVQSGFASGRHNQEQRGVAHLRPMNISREGRLVFDEVKYVEDESDRRVRAGDVVFNNTNSPALVGKTTYFDLDTPMAFSNHMTRLRVGGALMPQFLAAYFAKLWSDGFFEAICSNHVNQASVSVRRLQEIEVPLPTMIEQRRIMEIVGDHFARLDNALAIADQLESRIASERRSLLHAAFSGALSAQWRETQHG